MPATLTDADIARMEAKPLTDAEMQAHDAGGGQPSVTQRALANLPSSAANAVLHPVFPGMPVDADIRPGEEPRDAFERNKQSTIQGLKDLWHHPIDTVVNYVKERFATDPVGTALQIAALTKPAVEEIPAVQTGARAVTAAAKAAGPDVAAGALKVGAGAALDQMGAPYHVGALVGLERGAPQIGRGLVKGFKAGREAMSAPSEPAAAPIPALAATIPPESPPTAAPPGPPAPTPPPPAAPPTPAAAPPEIQKLPATEHPGAVDFAARARAQRAELAGPIADTLEKGGFTAELAKKLAPKDWLRLSKADGIGVNIPPKLARAVVDELDSRAAARDLAKTQQGTQAAADAGAAADAARRDTMIAPSDAYAEALKRPGALAAAKALADELGASEEQALIDARARRTAAAKQNPRKAEFDAAKAKR